MPTYNYHCADCTQDWKDAKSIDSRYEVYCPNCERYAGGGSGGKGISILIKRAPSVISDNLVPSGDRVAFPSLGRTASARTRAELREMQERIPESLWKRTEGEHQVKVPVLNEKTGRYEVETRTVQREGIEIDVPHTLEKGEEPAGESDG
jgi:hypothetical protein